MIDNQTTNIPNFIRRLMPTAKEVELRDATESFRQYMEVVLNIYERVARELGDDSLDFEFRGRVGDAQTLL